MSQLKVCLWTDPSTVLCDIGHLLCYSTCQTLCKSGCRKDVMNLIWAVGQSFPVLRLFDVWMSRTEEMQCGSLWDWHEVWSTRAHVGLSHLWNTLRVFILLPFSFLFDVKRYKLKCLPFFAALDFWLVINGSFWNSHPFFVNGLSIYVLYISISIQHNTIFLPLFIYSRSSQRYLDH